MRNMLNDVRYALRMMRRSPGFVAVAVVSLALGIGANTAIFTLVDAVLLRSLPVKEPGQLFVVGQMFDSRRGEHWTNPDYEGMRDGARAFDGLIAYSGSQPFGVASGSSDDVRTQVAYGVFVSGNYFPTIGVEPAAGRLLNPEDGRSPGAAPYMVLSHDFWSRQFAAAPDAVGRTVRVNGFPFTIVGVTRQGFKGVEVGVAPDFYIPLMMRGEATGYRQWNNRYNQWLLVMGRLKREATIAQAESELTVFYKQVEEREISSGVDPKRVNRARPVKLAPGAQGYSALRARLSQPLVVLMVIVGTVLLIACANVANLLLARAVSRQHEIAVRLAMGASRGRIARQLLIESGLLGLLGGAAGLWFATFGVKVLLNLMPQSGWTRLDLDVSPDFRVLGFTVTVSLLTSILFGLAPALQGTQPALIPALREEKGATTSRGRFHLRKALVVVQVALSLLLLIGAGLFVRSLSNLRSLDAGFRKDNILMVDIDPSRNGYKGQRLRDFYERLRERVQAVPGTRTATLARITPLSGSRTNGDVALPGPPIPGGKRRIVDINTVGPRFFETLGIPIVLGRDFRDEDSPSHSPDPPQTGGPPTGKSPEDLAGPHVAIVNESMVRRFFEGRNPIGMRLSLSETYSEAGSFEIVGVVKDARYYGLRRDAEAMVYLPLWRPGAGSRTLCLRVSGDPNRMIETVRRESQAIDSAIPLLRVRTMEQQVDNNLLQEQLVATLSGFFGLLALLLASVGLYGVIAHGVTRRTREIGVRMALGAQRPQVLWLVLRDALWMVLAGAVVGIPAALGLTKYAATLLYGIAPNDPLSIAAGTAVLIAVALFASYLPARRASRLDPNSALRYE